MTLKAFFKKVFPENFLKLLIYFKYECLDGFSIKSYSQEGEDMILRRIFDKKIGFYVDIGAHHPKRFSNTFYFYKKGWTGINVDALPGSMKMFRRSRPMDINIEKPISRKPQLLTYYMFNEPALNSFSKEISLTRNKLKEYKIINEKLIQTTTLEEILDKNLNKNIQIDFLSIDVEGYDFDVLKSNNFKKYRPKVIVIEILESTFESLLKNEIVLFLKKYNYEIISRSIYSVFFIQSDFLKNKGIYKN